MHSKEKTSKIEFLDAGLQNVTNIYPCKKMFAGWGTNFERILQTRAFLERFAQLMKAFCVKSSPFDRFVTTIPPSFRKLRSTAVSAFVEILQSLQCKIFQYSFLGQYPMKFQDFFFLCQI